VAALTICQLLVLPVYNQSQHVLVQRAQEIIKVFTEIDKKLVAAGDAQKVTLHGSFGF
jgi:hypothetical protein